jgi:putative ABC transport system permease protein
MAAIAIFISMLGVFALGSFICSSRTKEIGIRKVNGATALKIMVILNKDFLQWVALAFVIATPLTFFAMKKWLENFTSKTSLGWWIFGLSGLLIMLISLFTLSWQSYRVAISDPVESLKYE